MSNILRENWENYWKQVKKSGYVNYLEEIVQILTSFCADVSGKRILEIGSGTGGTSCLLAKKNAKVYCLDFSACALQITSELAKRQQVCLHLINGNAEKMGFKADFFDIIFHQGFLEHFKNPLPLIMEQRRVLKPGGLILIDVPQKYNFYTLMKHVRMFFNKWEYGWETQYSRKQLENLLKVNGFEIKQIYGRGYYPRIFYLARHLSRVENRIKCLGFTKRFWRIYDRLWIKFENSKMWPLLSLNIGIVAKKV